MLWWSGEQRRKAMIPSISSLTLQPMPPTSRSRVAARSGVPTTKWPRRRGRGPSNTAGALVRSGRGSRRVERYQPGRGTDWLRICHPEREQDLRSRIDHRHRVTGACRRYTTGLQSPPDVVEITVVRAPDIDRDQAPDGSFVEYHGGTTVGARVARGRITDQAHFAVVAGQ